MKIRTLVSIVLVLAASCAFAATKAPATRLSVKKPVVVVEGVQMPAWVERASGARDALTLGASVNSKDRVVTGAGARALLRLADGSLIRLGENGALVLDDLNQQKYNSKNVVTASLDVLRGAFRFTTQALSKFRGERDVKVRVVTITVGIRGTDLWARSDPARDIVCLLEGKVDVTRGDQAFTLEQPMAFYVAPRDKPGEPVGTVSTEQFAKWSQETEIAAGAGALRRGNKWRLYLADAGDQAAALKAYDMLRNAGYAAQIRPVTSEAGINYRVRISNLATKAEAAALGTKLKAQLGFAEPKVSR
ncbi:MAG: FecR domain-containing protein [Betaproteobacteria bacterium]